MNSQNYFRQSALATLFLAATLSVVSGQSLQTSVTKDGITWTFDHPVQVGQFVNGDYYIVGPVTATSISPLPTTSSPYKNGSLLNLPSANGKTGFDERLDEPYWFDASLRKYAPIALKPGDVLISSISLDQTRSVPEVMRSGDKSLSPVRTMSILTVLGSAVSSDSFRPSYCDRGQTIYHASNLQRNLLPSLAKPDPANTPSLGQFEALFRRPWVDTNRFLQDAPAEYMPSYSQRVAFAGSYAALLLMLDFPADQKVNLTNYFVQYGIDLFGCAASGFEGWSAFGGHGSGRKLPIIFAGTLLNDVRMKQVSNLYPDKFGEDMQTMYVNQTPPAGTYQSAWQGAKTVYGGHYGIRANGQVVEPGLYGPYEHLQPRNWPKDGSGQLLGEVYRRCCTSNSWVGEALAVQLLGAKNSWNYPAFFDYVDRWMMEDDTQAVADIQAQTGIDYSSDWLRQGQTKYMLQGGFPQNTFIDDMWKAYRNSQPPPPPPPPPTGDTTPPSVPAGLKATVVSSSQINLSWSASTDGVGVTGYRVYRGGTQIATTATTSFSNTGLTASTPYTYTVAAYDAAGNVSGQSAAATATTQAGSVPGGTLAASYSFEATSGTAATDSSGNGNTGTITKGTWVAGKLGQGLSFAGNGFVSIPDAASIDIAGPGSIEAWVKPTTLGIWHGILAKGNQNTEPAHNYALEINTANNVVCTIGNGSGANSITSTAAVAASQFTHVACTWDGTTVKLYVNGVLSGNTAQTITPAGNTSRLFIGKFGGNVDFFKGVLDEVRVYRGALTQAQVQADMQK